MSSPHLRSTPAPSIPVDACMCARGAQCSSFAPGHAVHLLQRRVVAATPSEWLDGVVSSADPASGELVVHALDGTELRLWNGAGAAAAASPGEPVAVHGRYHALWGAGRLYNVARLDRL